MCFHKIKLVASPWISDVWAFYYGIYWSLLKRNNFIIIIYRKGWGKVYPTWIYHRSYGPSILPFLVLRARLVVYRFLLWERKLFMAGFYFCIPSTFFIRLQGKKTCQIPFSTKFLTVRGLYCFGGILLKSVFNRNLSLYS